MKLKDLVNSKLINFGLELDLGDTIALAKDLRYMVAKGRMLSIAYQVRALCEKLGLEECDFASIVKWMEFYEVEEPKIKV